MLDEKNTYDYETIDDVFEEEIEVEDNYDDSLKLESFKNTSVFPMDLNADLIAQYYNQGKFVLDPEFQRRYVWDDKRKSKLIESMILNLPIPSLLFGVDTSSNKYIVIDGKQRLSAIIDFMAPNKDEKKNGKGFKLKNLDILSELNNYDFKKLCEDETKIEYLSQFQSYVFKSSFVKNYNKKLLYFIFARLNSGSVPLTTQELRHSLYPGEFSSFLMENSNKSSQIKRILKLKKDKADARMKDVELLCRFYAFKYFLADYDDTVGSLLDHTYSVITSGWNEKYGVIVKEDYVQFNKSIDFIYEIFGNDAFKLYSKDSKDFLKFNRLVFDIMSVTFSYKENRELVLDKKTEFVLFFKKLFDIEAFNDAFKPTTSTKEKTQARFRIFREEFEKTFKNL